MSVDGYAHCGRDKYLPVEALDEAMREASVQNAVICQHLEQYDNSYIASLVASRPGQFAGVALVDHHAPTWPAALEEVVRLGFRGVRVTSAALVDRPELSREAATAGLAQVIYAPEGIWAIAEPLRSVAAAHPRAAFVVSHVGNPSLDGERLSRGGELVDLAEVPNILVLLSGLAMFCAFPYAPLDRLVMSVVEAFGPERVMWGSNYPVSSGDPADYRRELELLLSGHRWGLDRSAVKAISDTTARRVWFQ